MAIVCVFVGLVVVVTVLAAVSFARDEARLRRRAAAELSTDLSSPALRARRAKVAELRDLRRPSSGPAGNTTTTVGGDPCGGVDVG